MLTSVHHWYRNKYTLLYFYKAETYIHTYDAEPDNRYIYYNTIILKRILCVLMAGHFLPTLERKAGKKL